MSFVSKGGVTVILQQQCSWTKPATSSPSEEFSPYSSVYAWSKYKPTQINRKRFLWLQCTLHPLCINCWCCHVLITGKRHPDTAPCFSPCVNPQQQKHRRKPRWSKGSEAFPHTSNLKLTPRTAKTVLLGSSHVVIYVKWAPHPSDHFPNVTVHRWVTRKASGLTNPEDRPPAPSWEAECFISRETGCICGFTTCESTCSAERENFNLKRCKYHKHYKHFTIKLQLPLLLSLWHASPLKCLANTLSHVLSQG